MVPNLKSYEKECRDFNWDNWQKEFSFSSDKNGVNYAYEVTNHQVNKGLGDKPAIISQGVNGDVSAITFSELAKKTDIVATNLQTAGLKAGDRFALYAPRSINYVVVLFAALKCGAIAVPLFEAFGSEAIKDRLNDCSASWIFTTRKLIENVNFKSIPSLVKVLSDGLIVDINIRLNGLEFFVLEEYLNTRIQLANISFGDLETPFIIHYTSGSTAKPKGILLANRAMIGHLVTAKYVLDLHPEDRFWNSGDPGWVTGMVYNFFAPLLVGVAAHIFEGPFSPTGWTDFMRRMNINVWYSTPTAFRLLRYYQAPLNRDNIPALRHIVSAGEPLNPSLVDWTMENLGIPIHDSWYMTENGHQLINNYRCLPIRKGSMGKSLPGIRAAIIDHEGNELPAGQIGRLAIATPWPGLMKNVWNDPEKFNSYFQKNWYISGDMAYQDDDGYFWFQGREDDMIKTAAERVSPFEIESVLVAHPAVAEAGVVGKPHDIYGSVVKAFVMLRPGFSGNMELEADIVNFVREHLSVHEVPREMEFVTSLPKTRSGKIMRRVLRSRETGGVMGDLSTMDVEMNPDSNRIISKL